MSNNWIVDKRVLSGLDISTISGMTSSFASLCRLENEIKKTETELVKAQERCDVLAEKLLDLRNQKKEYEAQQIAEAYFKSGKSLSEVMTFLQP